VSWVLILSLIVLSPLGVNAAAAQGTIKVVTDPAGAEVFVGDQRKGVTPVVIEGLPAGEHRVRIVKDGYLEHSQVVSVAPGVDVTVNVPLTRPAAATAPAEPTAAAEGSGDGWSTGKKALVGGGVAAIIAGTVALVGGGSSDAASNAQPVPGSISVTPAGQTLAGVTNFAFTAQGASDPEGQPLTYSWNFGDGTSGTGPTANHVYATGGTFTVSLSVSDGSESANTTTTVQVTDLNATWLSRIWEPWFTEGVARRVRFTQTGLQLTGTYRCNLAPAATGTVTGRLSPPNTVTFETHLRDDSGQDLGFTFAGRLNADMTAIIGVANGYRLNSRSIGFGRTDEE
jgi:hypothetical protein